jgi:hypothetical protein
MKHLANSSAPEAELTISLIREELKSRKLFLALHQVGLDDCYFQPHLDALILDSLGITEHTDDLFGQYDEILERHSKKITADGNSVTKHANGVYGELMALKETHPECRQVLSTKRRKEARMIVMRGNGEREGFGEDVWGL